MSQNASVYAGRLYRILLVQNLLILTLLYPCHPGMFRIAHGE